MRTKTLLIFVFLLTGMAFSQQGGSDRISLTKILSLLTLPAPEVVTLALEKDGYNSFQGGQYRKGNEIFTIFRKSDQDPLFYYELSPGRKRVEQFKSEALNNGFKVVTEDGTSWSMEGKGFSISAHPRLGIMIQKKK